MANSYGILEQSDPRAIEIIELISGVPVDDSYRGLGPAFFHKASAHHKPLLDEFMTIIAEDFPSYCSLFLKVIPKGSPGMRPFIFNQAQRIVWRKMVELMQAGKPLFLVILKARQVGMSTFSMAWLHWHLWRLHDVQTIVIAHEVKLAESLVGKLRVYHDELPEVPGIKPLLRKGSHSATIPRGELYYSDRRSSCVIHVAKNLDPRGMQATHIVESEYAFYPDPEALNGALLPQLPPRGSEARKSCSVIIESTPNGQNDFYRMYSKAVPAFAAQSTWKEKDSIDSEWTSIFLPWEILDDEYSIPTPDHFKLSQEEEKEQRHFSEIRRRYDGKGVTREQMYWRRMEIHDTYDLDAEKFDREYPSDDITCFLLRSDNAFRHVIKHLQAGVTASKDHAIEAWKERGMKVNGPVRCKISYAQKNEGKLEDITIVPDRQGKVLVWEPPKKGHVYVLGGDPCMGVEGGDNAVACVLDVREGRQVAEYCGVLNPFGFTDDCIALGMWYNTAMLVMEINTLGFTILDRITTRYYPNEYRWPKWDEAGKKTAKRGWMTNAMSRPLLFTSLLQYFEMGILDIASEELLRELSTFEKHLVDGDVDFRQQKSMHDDRVFATGLAVMGVKQTPKLNSIFGGQKQLPDAYDLGLSAAKLIIHQDKEMSETMALITGKAKELMPSNPLRFGAW